MVVIDRDRHAWYEINSLEKVKRLEQETFLDKEGVEVTRDSFEGIFAEGENLYIDLGYLPVVSDKIDRIKVALQEGENK